MNISTIITELRRRAQRLGGETPGSDGELMLHAANNLEGLMLNPSLEEPPSLPLCLDWWEISVVYNEIPIPPGLGWYLVACEPQGWLFARRRK